MNARTQQPCRSYAVRPAGESDSQSDDDDGYEVTGFSDSRRAKYNADPDSNPPPAGVNGNPSWQISNGGNENGDSGEDWEEARSITGGSVTPVAESWGRSPSEAVRLACIRGNLDKLKQLFSNGCSPGVDQLFTSTEETPLITSCMFGHYQLVEYLLKEKSANPNTRHPGAKITPLMAVVSNVEMDDEEILLQCVQALCEAGADLDMQNRFGHTALVIAIKQKRNLLAKYLIEKGADVNIVDPDSQSALFHAALEGNGKMCRLLLENGADIQLVDRQGWTAPEVAQDRGFDKLSEILYFARDSKWKPGLKPELMQQMDDEAIRCRRENVDSLALRDDSTIELMLSAIDASKYLVNFRKHKISYVQFLNLDDNQLREIGIEEVGVREKILDNTKRVHNVTWQSSSLVIPLSSNKNVTAAEAVCMIVSIRDHLEHISGSLQYITTRIKDKPLALQYDLERNKINSLMNFCEQAESNCNKVRQDVVEVRKLFGEIQGYTELQTAGQIPKSNFQTRVENKKSGKLFLNLPMSMSIGTGLLVLGLLQSRLNIFGVLSNTLKFK